MITISIKKASTIKEKIIGLIGKKEPIMLLINTRFGIHTFGLKFPIDVVILNQNSRVVKLKKSLKPNRIFLWNPIYDAVLELPEGSINRLKIKLKNVLDITN